jgi:lysophospholipase L1-like esterase
MTSGHKSRWQLAAVLLSLAVLAWPQTASRGDDQKKPANPAAVPLQRKDAGSVKRHEAFLERAKKGDVDVLFLGDSITQGWSGAGKELWQERFEPLKAANFGIGGDRTEHVLWRITEGKELEGIHPKVVVLMIGTNNMGSTGGSRDGQVSKTSVSAEQIADGIQTIVHTLRQQLPQTKVLLLGIFPRAAKPTTEARQKIQNVNQRIATLNDSRQVRYLDIGDKFLDKEGNLTPEIMPDYLHLSPAGYRIWADAIQPLLEALLKS